MPTVTYKCSESGTVKEKVFPYNAIGKAQAHEFAKTMEGIVKNNPGYGMEKTTKSTGY
jgi:hypothetical protein